jgi:hypothetical protein
VVAHGVPREVELGCDARGAQAARDAAGHLELALGEPVGLDDERCDVGRLGRLDDHRQLVGALQHRPVHEQPNPRAGIEPATWDQQHPSALCCPPPAIRENASITNAKDPSPSRAPTACSAVQTFSTTSRER